ncbi:MAG TPA: DUF998 domain-containing protein [Candidatus Dormibacteraeota bacterium]|nr:DUF998 domain-containing protein [Candidatus Dormibacteraeota bacterium]
MSTATAPAAPRVAASRLALLASLGVVIYLVIDGLLAVLRPDVSLLHQAESDYGVGPYSWLMDLNFLLRCALSLAAAGAILRLGAGSGRLRVGAGLLCAWGIGSGILAFFPDDPPGTPVTSAGGVHLIVALIAFLCVAVGTIVLSIGFRHFPELVAVSPLLLVLSLVAVVPLLLLGHTHFQAHSLDGLYERSFLALELLWLLVVALKLHQASAADPKAVADRP